jgi:hypothetical protein
VHSIPKKWKDTLKQQPHNGTIDDNLIFDIGNVEYDIRTINTKAIYQAMIKNMQEPYNIQSKHIYSFDLDANEFLKSFQACHKATISPKAKETQFKILHNYVATNKLLYKMKIKESPRCNFCNLYDQTTYHMFFECIEIKNFWFHVKQWLHNEFQCTLNLSLKNIILGDEIVSNGLCNILLYAKHFIYKCKYKEKIPHLDGFRAYLGKHIL